MREPGSVFVWGGGQTLTLRGARRNSFLSRFQVPDSEFPRKSIFLLFVETKGEEKRCRVDDASSSSILAAHNLAARSKATQYSWHKSNQRDRIMAPVNKPKHKGKALVAGATAGVFGKHAQKRTLVDPPWELWSKVKTSFMASIQRWRIILTIFFWIFLALDFNLAPQRFVVR